MSIEFALFLITAAAAGFYANRRLQIANTGLLPYRYGYFLAAALTVISFMAAVDLFTVMGEGRLSVTGLLGAVLAPPAVLGIVKRRTFGWWVLTGLIVLIGALAATLIGLSSTSAALVAIVITAAIVALNFRYVRRRRGEFGIGRTDGATRRSAAVTASPLRPIGGDDVRKSTAVDAPVTVRPADGPGAGGAIEPAGQIGGAPSG